MMALLLSWLSLEVLDRRITMQLAKAVMATQIVLQIIY